MKIPKIVALVCLSASLVTLAGCPVRQPLQGQEVSGLDKKFSRFAYIEDGDLVTFIVGTRAARYREESAYFPLEIAIGNRGVRQISLTRESFVLVDGEGNRYPAASPQELMEGYEFLDLDRTALAELEGIAFNKFAAFRRYPSKFSPTHMASTGRSNLVRDSLALPKFGYLIDYIYFPVPASGLMNKKFELFVSAPELEDPVFSRFMVD